MLPFGAIFFFFFPLKKYLFIFGCTESSLLSVGFLQVRQVGLLSSCRAGFSLQWLLVLWSTVSRVHGLLQWQPVGSVLQLPSSRAQAQQLWCMVLVVPRHVGSSQTRDHTGRRILNCWTTREVPYLLLELLVLCISFLCNSNSSLFPQGFGIFFLKWKYSNTA